MGRSLEINFTGWSLEICTASDSLLAAIVYASTEIIDEISRSVVLLPLMPPPEAYHFGWKDVERNPIGGVCGVEGWLCLVAEPIGELTVRTLKWGIQQHATQSWGIYVF